MQLKTCGKRGRPRKAADVQGVEWRVALRSRFVESAFIVCPDANRLLVEDVYEGRMTLPQWAQRYNISGTWVETWAEGQIWGWKSGFSIHPFFRPPAVEQDQIPLFCFSLSARPSCKFAHRVLTGGRLPHADIDNDIARFATEMREQFDSALNEYLETLTSRISLQVNIPTDIEGKLVLAAIYTLCGQSAEAILKLGLQLPVSDRSNVSRWLQEMMHLLGLPMRERFAKANRHPPQITSF